MTTKEYEELIKFLKLYCNEYIFRLPIKEEIKELDYYYGVTEYEWKSPSEYEDITIKIRENLNTDKLTFILECHDEDLIIQKTINNTYF